MEEQLPQDEDLSHLTTLASPVNTTPVHTVNIDVTSGRQEHTAQVVMEIDSTANAPALPVSTAPHLFPIFTCSTSRSERLDPIAIDVSYSYSSPVVLNSCTAANTSKSSSTLDYDKQIVDS